MCLCAHSVNHINLISIVACKNASTLLIFCLDRFDLLRYVFWKPSEATIFAIYRSLEPLFIAGRIPYGVMRVIFLEVPMLSLL